MRGWSYSPRYIENTTKLFPAHAGVILSSERIKKLKSSIPRSCGGDPRVKHFHVFATSYSPLMRGWSSWMGLCIFWYWLFPAHAGVILPISFATSKQKSIPRSCGGDPVLILAILSAYNYSPLMRGWSFMKDFLLDIKELFPAHAGVILKNFLLNF